MSVTSGGPGLGEPSSKAAAEPAPAPVPLKVLGLIMAGLALLNYLFGYLGSGAFGGFGGLLLFIGGVLAGLVVLPKLRRLMVPAVVSSVVGALLLAQQATVGSRLDTPLPGSELGALGVVSILLGALQLVAAVGALLVDQGVVSLSERPRGPAYGQPGYGQPGYGQYGQYSGQYGAQGYGASGAGGYPAAPAQQQYPGYPAAGQQQPQQGAYQAGPGTYPQPGYPAGGYSPAGYGQAAPGSPSAPGQSAPPSGYDPRYSGYPPSGPAAPGDPSANKPEPAKGSEATPGSSDADTNGDSDERTTFIRPSSGPEKPDEDPRS